METAGWILASNDTVNLQVEKGTESSAAVINERTYLHCSDLIANREIIHKMPL